MDCQPSASLSSAPLPLFVGTLGPFERPHLPVRRSTTHPMPYRSDITYRQRSLPLPLAIPGNEDLGAEVFMEKVVSRQVYCPIFVCSRQVSGRMDSDLCIPVERRASGSGLRNPGRQFPAYMDLQGT